MGRFEDLVYGLQADIEVPEQVWQKYTDTLSNLADRKETSPGTKRKKHLWIAALAAVLAIGAISVGASEYIQWSKSMREELQLTDKQQKALEDHEMAAYIGQSVTQGNVTVTVQDCIVDNYAAFISFKVEGYQPADGRQPAFVCFDVEFDAGEDDGFADGSDSYNFFEDANSYENDRMVSADGVQRCYIMEDGSLEYQLKMQRDKKGYFIGRKIHVEMKDLGVYGKEKGDVDVEVEAEGTWSFEWTLPGNDITQTYVLNAPLGESGATIRQAELSPLSAEILYEFPRQEETETAYDTNGEEMIHTFYAEPPYFYGVRMKDGTICHFSGAGSMGYTEDDKDIYRNITVSGRMIDAEQAADLLFVRSYPEGAEPFKEENFYIVPLK